MWWSRTAGPARAGARGSQGQAAGRMGRRGKAAPQATGQAAAGRPSCYRSHRSSRSNRSAGPGRRGWKRCAVAHRGLRLRWLRWLRGLRVGEAVRRCAQRATGQAAAGRPSCYRRYRSSRSNRSAGPGRRGWKRCAVAHRGLRLRWLRWLRGLRVGEAVRRCAQRATGQAAAGRPSCYRRYRSSRSNRSAGPGRRGAALMLTVRCCAPGRCLRKWGTLYSPRRGYCQSGGVSVA